MLDDKPRLLWTDDDGPDRFMFEYYSLERKGCKVEWAVDVFNALERLSRERFDALLLDQMLPFDKKDRETTPWGGCEVLRWLRGSPSRPDLAPPLPAHPSGTWPVPLEENRQIPVLVISAFYNEQVLAAMRGASKRDRELAISPKPTNIDDIERFLFRARGAR
jgi:CheY-like chemotaxis protein